MTSKGSVFCGCSQLAVFFGGRLHLFFRSLPLLSRRRWPPYVSLCACCCISLAPFFSPGFVLALFFLVLCPYIVCVCVCVCLFLGGTTVTSRHMLACTPTLLLTVHTHAPMHSFAPFCLAGQCAWHASGARRVGARAKHLEVTYR